MEEMRQMRKLLEANTKAIEATNKKVDNLSRAFEEETAEARLHRHIVSSKYVPLDLPHPPSLPPS